MNEQNEMLAPPQADPNPAMPADQRLVTPELLFLNQGTTYRLGAAFAGTANPSAVWQQMIDNAPAAMMYYRELEAKDDDIADAIAEVKLSVLSRNFQIIPGDDSSQAQKAADFIKKQIAAVSTWRNVLSALLDAPFYGYTVAELMFETSMGQAGLSSIVDCPQELFAFNPFTYPQVGQLRLKTYAQALDGDLVPESKFLVCSSRPRHGNRMGSPILREIYWASWFKRNCQRFWLRLAERGPGTAVVTHSDNATTDEKNKALRAAQALIEEVAIAVPESFKVLTDLLQGTRSADPATYQNLYNVLESKIYRRIVGGTLTSHGSDGGKGTQALGNVHAETKDERSVEHCFMLEDTLNRQLFRNLTLWNFGPDVAPPTAAFDKSKETDLRMLSDVANEAQGMGLQIPKKWAHEQFGIPEPDGDEPILVRSAPAVQPTLGSETTETSAFSADQQARVDRDTENLDTIFGEMRAEMLSENIARVKQLVEGAERAYATRG